MLADRGVNVDHSTLYRWVQRYAPEMEKRLRTLQGSAPGTPMKLISKLMAGGLTCTGLLTAKAVPSIFISLHVVTARRHIVFPGRF